MRGVIWWFGLKDGLVGRKKRNGRWEVIPYRVPRHRVTLDTQRADAVGAVGVE